MKVVDSIHENGAKLVEMSPDAISGLRAAQPGMRVVPVVYYTPAVKPIPVPESKPKAAGTVVAVKIELTVASAADGSPVRGATVVAFTDFANRIGVQATTNAHGVVRLDLGGASKKFERLYVYSPFGFWNALKRSVTVSSGQTIRLRPIDLAFKDVLRFFYGNAPLTAGGGVTVGVIDTGVAAHPDLTIDGGLNTVTGEDPNDFGDSGEGHGTHVAGIIAAHGTPPGGIRGLAPGVRLRSYRVFGAGQPSATNFAIAKAIDRAVEDRCDIINMSLGGGDPDVATQDAIAQARAAGTLVVVASGNDGRSPVSFPASDSLSLAVSALGRRGTFPPGVTEAGDVASPPGKDKHDFIAAFSNVGPEIDLTAPGVGVISTFPNGYAVLDGTSMACPAVTGAAARLLSMPANAPILAMNRDQARSDAMMKTVLDKAKTRGFEPILEGQGML